MFGKPVGGHGLAGLNDGFNLARVDALDLAILLLLQNYFERVLSIVFILRIVLILGLALMFVIH